MARVWFLAPLEHSEDLEDQKLARLPVAETRVEIE